MLFPVVSYEQNVYNIPRKGMFAREKHENRFSQCWGRDYKYSLEVAMDDAKTLKENPVAARFLARADALTAAAAAAAAVATASPNAASAGCVTDCSGTDGEEAAAAGLGLYNGCYQNWYAAAMKHGISAHSDKEDPWSLERPSSV